MTKLIETTIDTVSKVDKITGNKPDESAVNRYFIGETEKGSLVFTFDVNRGGLMVNNTFTTREGKSWYNWGQGPQALEKILADNNI